MGLTNRLKAAQPVLIATLLALLLRAWAVIVLPADFDEPVYLQNAFDYAQALRAGQISAAIDYPQNSEHPPLVKLLYAGAVLALRDSATWTNVFFASRGISALFGVLAILFLALAIDPLAAGLLAIHTLAIKYTSQAYLEALPHAMTLAAIVAFLRAEPDKGGRWLWISAVALGVVAASKYSYLPVTLVVLVYLALFDKKIKFRTLLLYGLLALGVFFALDLHLWREPLSRLLQSLTFHTQYAQSQHVQEVNFPWYQPLIWVFTSSPADWHPTVFFYGGFDGPMAILASLGLWREWKERRWLAIWFLSGLLFLLVWPTKWPQYAMTIVPALTLMAAETIRRIGHWIRAQETYWGWFSAMLPPPSRWVWGAIIAFAAFAIFIYASAVIQLTLGRIGWSNLNSENSPLPGDTINALLALPNDQLLIATDSGAALWTLAESETNQPSEWTTFDTTNSGLADDRVTALALGKDGSLWFGTPVGVSRFDNYTWHTFTAADLGLPDAAILSLASNENGIVYAGTRSGAAFFDGDAWHPIDYAAGQPVFAIACRADELWLSVPTGAWQIDLSSAQAVFHETEATIRQFAFDQSGTLWAATSGQGLARWDGTTWTYLTLSNSDLPQALVNSIVQGPSGELWVGTSAPIGPGGAVARFDGSQWQVFLTNNSGASGAEVTALAIQANTVWIGTRTAGIDLFQLGRTK